MSTHFDDLETRPPQTRDQQQMAALSQAVAAAQQHSGYYRETLGGIDPASITSREALASLPVTRKHDLISLMKAQPPFAGLNTTPVAQAGEIFTSPGPIFEMNTPRADFYDSARALFAAGFRSGDVIHNAFSYHLTPGAWIMHRGAQALGCPVIPAGIGNTEQQVQVIAQIKPKGYTGTPDFLKILIEKADAMGEDISSITHALVGGGPLFPQLRDFYASRGISCQQSFATAELGNIAYETATPDGLVEGMVVGEGRIVEILVPGTGDPVAQDGDVGELVVTLLNTDAPLIRFATGDLSAVMPGQSPCGRTNMRIRGWMGRADQTTKVRGMFIHPEQVAETIKRHPEVTRARLVVDAIDAKDHPVLKCEVSLESDALKTAIAESFQAVCKVRGQVDFVDSGSLPNDGKVIDDIRKFD